MTNDRSARPIELAVELLLLVFCFHEPLHPVTLLVAIRGEIVELFRLFTTNHALPRHLEDQGEFRFQFSF